MADGSYFCGDRGCSRWKKRNIINLKFDLYNALHLFYFPANDLQRNISNLGSCFGGRIYNGCYDVYGRWGSRRNQ